MKTFGEGRYEVTDELASSQLGRVYAVRATATGTRFALKTFSPKLDARELERFRREAKAMAALEHPNAVRCFDFGIEPDGTAFLVMDLADGRTLERIVADEGPLDAVRAAKLGAQIAAALEAAHARGIVHRDVQPSNVIVVRGYDGGEMAKVIDFGVASIEASEEVQRLTRAGELVGTPAYTAPEQLRGEDATPAADVYGLGATLYAVLAGEPPYASATAAGAIRAAMKGKRRPLAERRPEIGAAAAIVERAMALAPRDRHATAADLESELERFAGSRPKARAPIEPGSRAPRTSGRSIVTMWVALTTVISIGAALAILIAAQSAAPPDTIGPRPLAPVRPTLVEIGDAGARDAGTDAAVLTAESMSDPRPRPSFDAGFDGSTGVNAASMVDPRQPLDAGPPASPYRVRFTGSTSQVDVSRGNAVGRIGRALAPCVPPLPFGTRVWVDVTTVHMCVSTARAGGDGLSAGQQVCFDRAIRTAIPGCGLEFEWVPQPASFRLHYVVEGGR